MSFNDEQWLDIYNFGKKNKGTKTKDKISHVRLQKPWLALN